MSGPVRKRPWHGQSPCEKRAKIGPFQRETINTCTENQPSSSSSSSTSTSTTPAGGERNWNYLLRRKAEYINDSGNNAKAKGCYDGTATTISEPRAQGPTTSNEANNVFTLSQMTSEFQAVDDDAVNAGFWLDTTGETYGETESSQTFSESINGQESNATERVKIEPPCNGYSDPTENDFVSVYSSEISEQSHGINTSVNQKNQTMPQNLQNDRNDGNCESKQDIRKNVIVNSPSVERLIANIRNAVATNPNFKTRDEVEEIPAEIAVCNVCRKKCKGQAALASHIRIHPQCKCGKYFVAKVFNKHTMNCPVVNTIVCHVCHAACIGQDALNKHIKIHPQCKCGKLFLDKVSKGHRKKCVHLHPEIVLCHVCRKKCKGKKALAGHVKIHPQCKCGEFFMNTVSKKFKKHKKNCPEFNPVTDTPQAHAAVLAARHV